MPQREVQLLVDGMVIARGQPYSRRERNADQTAAGLRHILTTVLTSRRKAPRSSERVIMDHDPAGNGLVEAATDSYHGSTPGYQSVVEG